MVIPAVRAELQVVGFGPGRPEARESRELMKGLAQKFGTSQPPVHPFRLAAVHSDRSDSREALDVGGTLISIPVIAPSRQQARCKGSTGSAFASAPMAANPPAAATDVSAPLSSTALSCSVSSPCPPHHQLSRRFHSLRQLCAPLLGQRPPNLRFSPGLQFDSFHQSPLRQAV